MKINRTTLASVAALAVVGGAGIFGLNSVSAQDNQSTLVEKIASRFNLNQDEVQTVFDEYRDEMHAERKSNFSERLQEKVDDGTITAEQKTLIEQKMEELEAKREELKDSDMTHEERHEQMKQQREELQTWAEENDIPLDEIMPFGRGGHGRGMRGMHGMMRGMPDDNNQDSQSDNSDDNAETSSQSS